MRIIARRALREFSERHADARAPLDGWWALAARADWAGPQDVKNQIPTASIVGNNRVVFNIRGNAYRLVVAFDYPRRLGWIKFVGAHAAYDAIDVETVDDY